jgi:hypothetical protein
MSGADSSRFVDSNLKMDHLQTSISLIQILSLLHRDLYIYINIYIYIFIYTIVYTSIPAYLSLIVSISLYPVVISQTYPSPSPALCFLARQLWAVAAWPSPIGTKQLKGINLVIHRRIL